MLSLRTVERMAELSEQDRAILTLEATVAGRAGEKERRARQELGLSGTEY